MLEEAVATSAEWRWNSGEAEEEWTPSINLGMPV